METAFLDKVLQLHREERWRDILKLNENSDKFVATKLLWVWPSEKNLNFIRKVSDELGCQGIVSVGCGCGLLEWIINKSTGLHVIGYEVNQEWWDSKYCNPRFIELNYSDGLDEIRLNSNYALLFCYFNDSLAFLEYVNNYNGTVVIIIGPGKAKGWHSDPAPFDVDFQDPDWRLYRSEEVKDSKDFIAVYVRNKIAH